MLGYIILVGVGAFFWPQPAYAYLDPGTASFFIQILVAVAVGSLVAVKTFWTQIKGFFGGKTDVEEEDEEDPS